MNIQPFDRWHILIALLTYGLLNPIQSMNAGSIPTPLLEYHFNEGSGTTALNTGSVAGSDGGVSNATYSADTPSGSGSSLHFDGDTDFVEIPDTFDYGSAFTIEAWIKPEAKDGQRAIYDDYGSPGVFFCLIDGRVQISTSTANNPGQGVSVFAGSVCLGVWQHVAATYDGAELRVFINGVDTGLSTAASGAVIDNTNHATHVGADSAQPVFLEFQGSIDDLRVFNTALSPSQLGGGLATNGVTCATADLRLTKIDSPDPVTVGSNLTYTLTITNAGPGDASNVVLTDTLPSSATFVSASVTSSNSGQKVICNLGSLAFGASTNVDVVVTPTIAGAITNSASVLADEPDAVINQSATAITTVEPPSVAGTDLTADLDVSTPTCGPDSKGKNEVCVSSGTLALENNGVPYVSADIVLSRSCKLLPKVGCSVTACLTLTAFDLGALPDHAIQVYLSDDATLDAGDTPLIKKLVATVSLLKYFTKDQQYCPKLKLPKGVLPTGKYLIIEVDALIPKTGTDAVTETDETNNTAVFGPIP